MRRRTVGGPDETDFRKRDDVTVAPRKAHPQALSAQALVDNRPIDVEHAARAVHSLFTHLWTKVVT
jgi:hypothetical protein